MEKWQASNIPSQAGRSVVVTGAGGLGYQDALALAQAGAEVIIASRNPAKGAASVRNIQAASPMAKVSFEALDLSSLASVKAFAETMKARRESLDLLINNAGVMAPPKREVTSDGLELQFETNYLGAFALTAHLMPLLRRGRNPRVVSVSSFADRTASIDFDDLQAARNYKPMVAYGQSKLALLMFALQLQQRSDGAGWGVASLAAHPGISRTDIVANGPGAKSAMSRILGVVGPLVTQPAAQGALPTLFAATSPKAKGGGYYGPSGLNGLKGWPAPSKIPPKAEDAASRARLWETSEQLAGIRFA